MTNFESPNQIKTLQAPAISPRPRSKSCDLGFGTFDVRTVVTLLILAPALIPAFAKEPPRATIRVLVKAASGPLAGAIVTMNDATTRTDQDGIATTTLPLGKVDVGV